MTPGKLDLECGQYGAILNTADYRADEWEFWFSPPDRSRCSSMNPALTPLK